VQIKDSLTDRIDLPLRNYIARERSTLARIGRNAVGRIENRRTALGEVAGAFEICRNDGFNVDRITLAYFFKISKEECPVFDERTAQSKSIRIADVVRFVSGVEKITRIKIRALAIPPAATVEFVGALLEQHVHHRTAVVTELGGEAIVLH